ncbi:MAG TPA: hypothetical protein VEO74_04985, partial [Thermoanaerobaculia bacterium]|nr:hypothetical protein [Thermoanaerobaculia bacterium]
MTMPGTLGATTLTGPLEPFSALAVTVAVNEPPALTVAAEGAMASAKSGAAGIVTVSVAVRVPLTPGAVAVKVKERTPGVAPAATATVTGCELPGPSENVAGENVTSDAEGEVTPAVPLKPLIGVMVAAVVPEEPAAIVSDAGFTF